MWSKLSNFVKRNSQPDLDDSEEQAQHNTQDASETANASVMSHVYEQHPNLSHFHSGSAIRLASPSPPVSPSKGSKRSMFKRSLKAKLTSTPVSQGTQDTALSPASSSWTSPSPVNLGTKKVRASLQVDTFTAQASKIESAPLSAPLPAQPYTPTVAEQRHDGVFDPQFEVQPAGTGSIRSILRERNTPGTGQSVRFFSRDAYRVISPNVSELEIDEDAIPDSGAFLDKLRLVSPERSGLSGGGASTSYHSLPSSSPDNTVDIFFSPCQDSSAKSRKPLPFQPRHPPRTRNSSGGSSRSAHSRSDSGSFSGSNSQSLSSLTIPMPPADMPNLFDVSHELVEKQTTSTLCLNTSDGFVVHSQEELVASLREQLSLQHQLASQFEIDLAARDELVSLLSTQLRDAETGAEKYRKEVERRQSAMRALRRKVGELEKICRGLEDEVERSREESFERSVMDEASEGALVVLHGSIGQLKGDLEKAKDVEAKLTEECDALKCKVAEIGSEKIGLEEREKELSALVESKMDEIKQLEGKVEELSQAGINAQETIDSLRSDMADKQQMIDDEREKYNLAESQWLEEKAGLITRLEAHGSSQDSHDADVKILQRKLDEREEEVKVLKAEVEAQWDHAEKADEKITRLEGEKEGLAKSVQALHSKVEEVGSQWKESDGRRAELEEELSDTLAAKGEIEEERDHLVEDVNFEREHAEQLSQALQDCTSKVDELEKERGYALNNVSRLEELLRRRDAEIEEAQSRIVDREQEAEQLRAQTNKMKREHSRSADEQNRRIDEIIRREKVARMDMENAVRQKAEDEVALGSIKERVATLTNEVNRLRRQVHDLQQESADKEVKLLQLTKARAQDEEDKEGLNIALDSKQQELELLKRKIGVKGTGGSTPVPTRMGLPDLGSRRQSVAFTTPSASRPRPGSAIGIIKPSATETPIKKSLSSSIGVRAGLSTARPSRMGPPATPRGTPLSASTSSLARSTSGSKPRSAPPVSHRRSSSVMSSNANHLAESDKENEAPVKPAARKTSTLVPA